MILIDKVDFLVDSYSIDSLSCFQRLVKINDDCNGFDFKIQTMTKNSRRLHEKKMYVLSKWDYTINRVN